MRRGRSRRPPAQPTSRRRERRLSGALMRVNHVGEVCAQALYQAQALTARVTDSAPADAARRARRSGSPGLDRAAPRTNWATAPACSIRCGTPAPSASACSPAGPAIAGAWASWSRPSARSSSTWPATSTACRARDARFARDRRADEGRRSAARGRGRAQPAPRRCRRRCRLAMRLAARVMTHDGPLRLSYAQPTNS